MAIATEDATAIRAAAGGAEKRAYVRQIFSEIAPRYDLLNHVLSLNIDRGWRRKAIAELGIERNPRGTFLDLCAGTMDVSVALFDRVHAEMCFDAVRGQHARFVLELCARPALLEQEIA